VINAPVINKNKRNKSQYRKDLPMALSFGKAVWLNSELIKQFTPILNYLNPGKRISGGR